MTEKVEALVEALVDECVLIDELSDVMRRQRSAVSVEDIPSVDDSVFTTHRLLLNLSEIRKRRHTLTALLGGPEQTPLSQLDAVLGEQASPSLKIVRDRLRDAAFQLSREIDVNRRILREALSSGDAQTRTLRGKAVYDPNGTPAFSPPPAVSFSKTA